MNLSSYYLRPIRQLRLMSSLDGAELARARLLFIVKNDRETAKCWRWAFKGWKFKSVNGYPKGLYRLEVRK